MNPRKLMKRKYSVHTTPPSSSQATISGMAVSPAAQAPLMEKETPSPTQAREKIAPPIAFAIGSTARLIVSSRPTEAIPPSAAASCPTTGPKAASIVVIPSSVRFQHETPRLTAGYVNKSSARVSNSSRVCGLPTSQPCA